MGGVDGWSLLEFITYVHVFPSLYFCLILYHPWCTCSYYIYIYIYISFSLSLSLSCVYSLLGDVSWWTDYSDWSWRWDTEVLECICKIKIIKSKYRLALLFLYFNCYCLSVFVSLSLSLNRKPTLHLIWSHISDNNVHYFLSLSTSHHLLVFHSLISLSTRLPLYSVLSLFGFVSLFTSYLINPACVSFSM